MSSVSHRDAYAHTSPDRCRMTETSGSSHVREARTSAEHSCGGKDAATAIWQRAVRRNDRGPFAMRR